MQGELGLYFDGLDDLLSVSWDKAVDLDTLVNLFAYQINFTPTSNGKLNNDLWEDLGILRSRTINVSTDDDFLIGVRAVDDFGNASEPLISQWTFPENFNL